MANGEATGQSRRVKTAGESFRELLAQSMSPAPPAPPEDERLAEGPLAPATETEE